MDAFYASVHQRDDASLRGKPLVVGGDPNGRGVVAAASYEVRRFGVRSAMPCAQAIRLCPQAIFIRPEFVRYREESQKIFAIYRDFTPVLQPLSLDEAYLDVSEHMRGYETAMEIAQEIRRRVREERSLTVSIGVAPNKLVAKIASDHRKPDGLTVVAPQRVAGFLAPLPARALMGVGQATAERLSQLGVETIADLRRLSLRTLLDRFGKYGGRLYEFARGRDERPVRSEWKRKSLGTERTYATDLTDRDAMEAELERLAEQVAESLTRRDLKALAVTIKVRYASFQTVTRSRTLPRPSDDVSELQRCARDLLARTEAGKRPVRLLGVTASRLDSEEAQLELFS